MTNYGNLSFFKIVNPNPLPTNSALAFATLTIIFLQAFQAALCSLLYATSGEPFRNDPNLFGFEPRALNLATHMTTTLNI